MPIFWDGKNFVSSKYKITDSSFLAASDENQSLPKGSGLEVCFVGRSNVGKSSLINTVLGRKSLARIGKTPGSTKKICLYKVSYLENRSNASKKEKIGTLVDLPGYGYAKTSQENKVLWSNLISKYLIERNNLSLVVLLIDVRRDIGEEENNILDLARENGGGLVIALTKADKLKKNELNKRLNYFMENSNVSKEMIFLTSSLKSDFKTGILNLRDLVCEHFIR